MLDTDAPKTTGNQALELAIIGSILDAADAMIYRCANDAHYTMEFITGNPWALSGYKTSDLIGNKIASWVGITCPDDVDRVFAEVDRAIEENRVWDVSYRIVHRDGQHVWVRERGLAIHEGEELKYLQGLIVSAREERRQFQRAEEILERTRTANSEIMGLADRITTSVQTLSILAINARIEAARSGEAGRGFAVVADEISTLAAQNGGWAEEIAARMSDSGNSGEA